MALRVKKRRLQFSAIRLANVVLPTPGGPHKIIDGIMPLSSNFLSAVFAPIRCSCPMKLSNDLGLILSANGMEINLIHLLTQLSANSPAFRKYCFLAFLISTATTLYSGHRASLSETPDVKIFTSTSGK